MSRILLKSLFVAVSFAVVSLIAGCAMQPNYPNEAPLGQQPRYLNGYYNNPFFYGPPFGIYEGPEQEHHEEQQEEPHEHESQQQENLEGDQKEDQEERNEHEGD